MQLLRSPWVEAFDEFGQAIRSNAILVAPYIQAGPLERLKEPLLKLESRPHIDLITDLDADDLFRKMVDTAAIIQFVRDLSEEWVTVWSLPGLHAKTYVADESLAIITSGNLTEKSLKENAEYGVKITEPELVRQVIAHIREYSASSTVIPLSHLEQIKERTAEAQSLAEPHLAENQAMRELRQDIAAILSDLKDKEEVSRQVFSRTILDILRERSPLSTPQMYRIIRQRHPELCDDSIIKEVGKHKEPRWKHQVRVAQRSHRESGRIARFAADRKWYLSSELPPLLA